MRRFRGVSTKYLHRYLTWHVLHERVQGASAMKERSVLLGNTAEAPWHGRARQVVQPDAVPSSETAPPNVCPT